MPALRNAYSRTNVIAHPLPSAIRLNACKNVKAQLRPRIDSLSEFQRLVHSVICREHPILHRLRPLKSEVGVKFYHRRARGDGVGAIYLNFVVTLPANQCRETKASKEQKNGESRDIGHEWAGM